MDHGTCSPPATVSTLKPTFDWAAVVTSPVPRPVGAIGPSPQAEQKTIIRTIKEHDDVSDTN
jgi:hypothetical protein